MLLEQEEPWSTQSEESQQCIHMMTCPAWPLHETQRLSTRTTGLCGTCTTANHDCTISGILRRGCLVLESACGPWPSVFEGFIPPGLKKGAKRPRRAFWVNRCTVNTSLQVSDAVFTRPQRVVKLHRIMSGTSCRHSGLGRCGSVCVERDKVSLVCDECGYMETC